MTGQIKCFALLSLPPKVQEEVMANKTTEFNIYYQHVDKRAIDIIVKRLENAATNREEQSTFGVN